MKTKSIIILFQFMSFLISAQETKVPISFSLNTLATQALTNAIERKTISGESGTLGYFVFEKGAIVPSHQHINEQYTLILQGSVNVTVDGKQYLLKAGDGIVIPPNAIHSFESLEDGTVDLDFFTPQRKDWIEGTDDYFQLSRTRMGENKNLEVVTSLSNRPGNVAVSPSGRVFATVHPLGGKNLQLIEFKGNGNYVPYPSTEFQKGEGPAHHDAFDAPLGITFDNEGRLWTVDMGLELGKTRLWCIDVKTNKVIRKIELPQHIAPKGSFVQDLAVDSKNGWAYLADIANPGIIALNLKTDESRRLSYPQFQPEDVDMIIDGKLVYFGGKPARVGVNPITLSKNGNVLYFGSMNGLSWYSLDATLIRQMKADKAIGASIKKVGDKPISDGVATDHFGNHYFTNITEHGISKLDAKGNLTILFTDSRIQWPDNVSLSPDGSIYISVNQLNTTPAFTGGKDEGVAPYYIYRFKD